MKQHHPTAIVGRRLMPSSECKKVLGGQSEMTRWRHAKAGIGPVPVKIGNRNYYFEDEVLAYLEELAASRNGHGAGPADRGEADGSPAEHFAASACNE